MKVLVDTSIWSLALRRKAEQLSNAEKLRVSWLAGLIEEQRVLMMGLIRQELLTGVRHRVTFEDLRGRLRAFPDLPVATADHERAADFANQCRKKGVSGSPVDFLISSVAFRLKAAVFTDDKDFDRYSEIIPLRLHTGLL